MLDKRAKEIASSPVMADVTFNGSKVYIESVDENNGTAVIHFLDQPQTKQEVPTNNLVEQ